MSHNYIIATAKRLADLYGIWYNNSDPNRFEKFIEMLSGQPNPKIREKARNLVKYRYGE